VVNFGDALLLLPHNELDVFCAAIKLYFGAVIRCGSQLSVVVLLRLKRRERPLAIMRVGIF